MKDNRDPMKLGAHLLRMVEMRDGKLPLTVIADEEFRSCTFFDFPGDESPVERYGDPRGYDVEVSTTVRRVPRTFAEVVYSDADGAMPLERVYRVGDPYPLPPIEKLG